MKIAVRGGHNYNVPGAVSIVNEVVEDRKIKDAIIKYLKLSSCEVLDVTPDKTNTSAEDLIYGVSRANTWVADLFISVHLNAGGGQGCETLYYNGSTKGKDYATKITNAIANLGFKNRGAKVDVRGLYELKNSKMPTVISESFFVDSQSDVNLYNKLGADKIGKVIAESILGKAIQNISNTENSSKKTTTSFRQLEILQGEDVKLIQNILYKLKLLYHLTGFYDMETRKAVLDYQKAHSALKATGIVDKDTWDSLMFHK